MAEIVPRVKIQRKGHGWHFGILNDNEENDKMLNSVISFFKKKGENVQEEMRCRRLGFFTFSERVSDFFLKSREIQPSNSFGARRKVVIRGEGNAWAPISWSFDKLREVGVLSYLLYSRFKCFVDGCVGLRP